MKNLLTKYILLNKKNIMFGVLATVVYSFISFDEQRFYPVALLMCPSLLFSFVVGKMCYMEDSDATQQFLLSLPISKRDLVFEKNIVSYICIAAGMAIASFMQFLAVIIMKREFDWNVNLIIIFFVISILYNTIYISLNYKYDYSKVQFTSFILVGLMLVAIKFGNDIINTINASGFWIFTCIGIVTIALNYLVLRKIASL